MDFGRVDVRPWNLGVSLLVAAACGPTVVQDGPQADSQGDTEGETESNTGIDDDSSTTDDPGRCVVDSDCALDEVCTDGVCEYQEPECFYECCYDPCCYDGGYGCNDYECYDDDSCGADEACIDYECVPDPGVPHECSGWPVLLGSPTPLIDNTGPVALAFVDAHAPSGREIAAAGVAGVQLASANGTVVAVTEEPTTDLTVADLDADGKEDLLLLEPTGLRTMIADGPGSFVSFATVALEQPGDAVLLADFDRNGVKDAWVRTGASLSRFVGAGDGNFGPAELVTDSAGAVLASPAGSGFDNLLVQADTSLSLALANDAGTFEPTPLASFATAPSSLASADFELDGLFDAVALVPPVGDGVGSVTIFDNLAAAAPPATWQLPSGDWVALAAGDVDGDGRPDLVVAGSTGGLLVRFGADAKIGDDGAVDPLGCYLVKQDPAVVQRVIAGDYDGDGTGDIVTSDGVGVLLWPSLIPI
ncbi:MAG: VCBS repeat-containing protein [Nannocystaceae bacterium]|nr:VCBS repeat-containing protein [Nannocystaceae bacterium]